jgi:proteasome lid subunit RPN8/RPN11
VRLRRQRPGLRVHVARTAIDTAHALAFQALPRETGGILLGHRVEGDVLVQRFLEIRDARAGPAEYRRQHAPAEKALARALANERDDPLLGYVGEWHSHPAAERSSRRDLRELRLTAQGTPHPIALIVLSRRGEDSWQFDTWIARGPRHSRAQVVEMSNRSERGEN